jgi:hypothetical protein
VECCAIGSLSEKNVVTRCEPTTSWSPRRSAGNLDGVGSASAKPVLALGQPLPTGPDYRWSSRGPVRRGHSQTPVPIVFADALPASALDGDPVE